MGAGNRTWPQAHTDALVHLKATTSLSYTDIAFRINEMFGTKYTRHAMLGRAHRMGLCAKRGDVSPTLSMERLHRRRSQYNNLKKLRRWTANPSLADRARKLEEKKRLRAIARSKNTAPTSAYYRKQMPRLPEMSRNELRDMLAAAIRNTAALEIGA